MALFIYGTATNTGKGFFTHQDRQNFYLSGQPANVWVVGNNEKGALWLAEKNGVEKTKTEAQALVTAEVELLHKKRGMHCLKQNNVCQVDLVK